MESVWQGPLALGGRRAVKSTDDPFGELFAHYYPPVVAFFARRGFSNEEARDLAQKTFLRAFEKFATLRDPGAARSWLFAVAVNVRRNALRSSKAAKRDAEVVALAEDAEAAGERALSANPGRAGEENALDKILTREREERLRRALDQLPPRMREAVYLRIGRDLKYHEIAVLQQVSVDTIKAQMLQARRKLRELLGDYFTGIDF